MLMSCSRVPRRVQSYNSPYFQTEAFVPLGSGKSGFESRRSDFYRYKLPTCLISRVLVHSRNQLPEFKSKSNMENSCRLRVCSTSFSCEMGGIETIQSPLKREAGIMFFQDLFFCDVKRDIQRKPCFQHLHLHSVPFCFLFKSGIPRNLVASSCFLSDAFPCKFQCFLPSSIVLEVVISKAKRIEWINR